MMPRSLVLLMQISLGMCLTRVTKQTFAKSISFVEVEADTAVVAATEVGEGVYAGAGVGADCAAA